MNLSDQAIALHSTANQREGRERHAILVVKCMQEDGAAGTILSLSDYGTQSHLLRKKTTQITLQKRHKSFSLFLLLLSCNFS